MRFSRITNLRGGSSLVVAALLIAAVSPLPAGDNRDPDDDQYSRGSFVSTVVDGSSFSFSMTGGETSQQATDQLVIDINGDVNFTATNLTGPNPFFGPNAVLYRVLKDDGSELDSSIVCEDDQNFTSVGTYFYGGKAEAIVLKPTLPAGPWLGDGSFGISVKMLSSTPAIPTVPTTGLTVLATLITNIETALTGQGFTLTDVNVDTGNNPSAAAWKITKSGDYFLGIEIDVTDTKISGEENWAELQGADSPGGGDPDPADVIPTLSEYGLALLAAALLLAGLMMIRRKRAATG